MHCKGEADFLRPFTTGPNSSFGKAYVINALATLADALSLGSVLGPVVSESSSAMLRKQTLKSCLDSHRNQNIRASLIPLNNNDETTSGCGATVMNQS